MKEIIQKIWILIAMLCVSISASAYDFKVDGIYYNKNGDNTVSVTYLSRTDNSYSGSVTIPESVTYGGTTYTVTAIGENAFNRCYDLTSVSIPNSVTTIGEQAFSYCSGLTTVTIPGSVTSIDNSAFSGCSGLTTVTIPGSVTSIGNNAFYRCRGLTSVTIPGSVTSIGDYAFDGCTIYKAFWLCNTPPQGASNLSAKVNYVSNNEFSFSCQKVYPFLSSMFEVDNVVYVPVSPSDRTCDVVDCNYLNLSENITVPDKVNNKGIELTVLNINEYSFCSNSIIKNISLSNQGYIGESAFSGCTGLTEVIIPNSVKSLGSNAFYGCSALTHVSIGKGVSSLPEGLFSGCSSLPEISIPGNVSSVAGNVFKGCASLCDVTIEDGSTVLSLGSNGSMPLFSDCPLDEVYIGRKLSYSASSESGYSPFYRNTSLRAVRITNAETKIYDNQFYGCSGLQSLEIGNGVTTIGRWAFSGCSAMQTFACGSRVETIGEEAFSDCTGLKSFKSKAVNPPACGNQALDDINKWECVLHVPAASEPKYQAASQWKEFFFVNGDASKPVTAISLQHTAEMKVGETQMIRATVTPADATDATIEWSSSDESVASVNFNGTVTAKAPGTVTITATAADGSGVTASCEITVSYPAAIGDVDAAEATVRVIGGEIVVEGAPVGTVVRIFAIDGMELYRSVSTGEAVVFAPGVRGVCLVAVGNRCVKISL